jgi:hypothetical protein
MRRILLWRERPRRADGSAHLPNSRVRAIQSHIILVSEDQRRYFFQGFHVRAVERYALVSDECDCPLGM